MSCIRLIASVAAILLTSSVVVGCTDAEPLTTEPQELRGVLPAADEAAVVPVTLTLPAAGVQEVIAPTVVLDVIPVGASAELIEPADLIVELGPMAGLELPEEGRISRGDEPLVAPLDPMALCGVQPDCVLQADVTVQYDGPAELEGPLEFEIVVELQGDPMPPAPTPMP